MQLIEPARMLPNQRGLVFDEHTSEYACPKACSLSRPPLVWRGQCVSTTALLHRPKYAMRSLSVPLRRVSLYRYAIQDLL
jgi:hypothetical protein